MCACAYVCVCVYVCVKCEGVCMCVMLCVCVRVCVKQDITRCRPRHLGTWSPRDACERCTLPVATLCTKYPIQLQYMQTHGTIDTKYHVMFEQPLPRPPGFYVATLDIKGGQSKAGA